MGTWMYHFKDKTISLFMYLFPILQDVLESCYVLRDQNRCGSIGEAVQKGLDDACSVGKFCSNLVMT